MSQIEIFKKCFLIDNDEEDREIFSMALHEADPSITCFFAKDGMHGLALLNADESFIPYLIFVDLNMPLMNGVECLEQLKKIERIKDVPVYIYSTAADPESVADVMKMGAADFIVKPYSYAALTNLLSNLLQEKTPQV